MFVGSCIGIIGIVLLHEFLNRLQREYERLIQAQQTPISTNHDTRTSHPSIPNGNGSSTNCNHGVDTESRSASTHPPLIVEEPQWQRGTCYVRTLRHQAVYAAIRTTEFAVALFIMLLAMSFNGYITMCIFLGSFIGFMIFGWDVQGARRCEPAFLQAQ